MPQNRRENDAKRRKKGTKTTQKRRAPPKKNRRAGSIPVYSLYADCLQVSNNRTEGKLFTSYPINESWILPIPTYICEMHGDHMLPTEFD